MNGRPKVKVSQSFALAAKARTGTVLDRTESDLWRLVDLKNGLARVSNAKGNKELAEHNRHWLASTLARECVFSLH
jgi:hypothetical protein